MAKAETEPWSQVLKENKSDDDKDAHRDPSVCSSPAAPGPFYRNPSLSVLQPWAPDSHADVQGDIVAVHTGEPRSSESACKLIGNKVCVC